MARNNQQPSGMPISKYRSFHDVNGIDFPQRTWPNGRITAAPRWLSTDLRDGNQALIEPMDPARKRTLFDLLVRMGFKEIEVGFPSASAADFDFVRSLVEDGAVPSDVMVSVLTQSRTDLIERTVQSVVGLPRSTVHLYNATAPVFRQVVFHSDRAGIKKLAVDGTRDVIQFAQKYLDDVEEFGYEYSPEIFIDTEMDYALEVCEAVMDEWGVGEDRPIILNLPATVERITPNVYADQIEWMSTHLSRREHVCVSVHPHNDRGCAVAAAELSLMGGADRVEGCLFGQGERTGNVDLVTMAMNLFSQGVDPQLDLSHIDDVRRTWEYCNQMTVPPRQPWGGELVYTAFSGSHQDAIKKGLEARKATMVREGKTDLEVPWDVPYLPVDPRDVGRSYEAVIRVNSQSGKGGIAYLLKSEHNMDLPRRLQIEFSRVVQRHLDVSGREVSGEELWSLFTDEYLPTPDAARLAPWGRFVLRSVSTQSSGDGSADSLIAELTDAGAPVTLRGSGNGPIDAFVAGLKDLGVEVSVLDYAEHALSEGGDATAAAYVECQVFEHKLWGVGIDPSITTASLKAIISAVNREFRRS